MILTGGPGVGKTTIVKSILGIIAAKDFKITLCAPTGRAAKRLSESTGQPAKTIHRLLELRPGKEGNRYDQNNPLDTNFVVVDEASVIDVSLMNSLLKAIPSHAGLLIVGDMDQLPSVGSGAVLGDLIHSNIIPTARLTKIFRQSKTSDIVINAHRINEGKYPGLEENKETDFYFIETDTPEKTHEILLQSCHKKNARSL
jgi:exodeoxyribonuclease V alpha subunit